MSGARRQRLTGWERFALEYAAALERIAGDWCTVVPLGDHHRPGGRIRTHLHQIIRYAFGDRRRADITRIDVLHALTFPPGNTGGPTVWTVHDDLVLGGHPEYARSGAKMWVPLARRALRWTDRVITDTRAVAAELAALGVPEGKLRVVTPGIPTLEDPVPPRSRPVCMADGGEVTLPDEFLLSVGTIEERKRPYLAATVAARIGMPIVMVGRVDRSFRVERWPEGTLRIEGVSDAELSWLYRKAFTLLAMSQYEGFDFPLLEALSVGTPVVATDIPVHRELASDVAVLVPPEVDAVADAVRRATAPGPSELPTWEDCVDGYQRIYAELA